MAERTEIGAGEYIEQHLGDALEDLTTLCAQPSVASHGEGMLECAQLVSGMLRERGFEVALMPVPGAPPAVYAERAGRSDRTLLLYNHYDVQPPEPLELWDSPPFEPSIRDGGFYARGATDDKGHIASRLAAIDALLATTGDLPCRVKFLIEGGEEISSPGIPAFVREHRELLAADACIWEFGGVDYEGRPQLTLGMRGICYLELHAETAGRDAHSGLGGSIFPNAAWRLTWALASLKGPDERVRIPGFYDRVRPPSARDLELLELLPDQAAAMRETYGLRDGFLGGRSGAELRRAAVFEPTCTICGLSAGYEGEGLKTVLPARALAKVDFRLVPEQTPEEVVAKLRAHLEREGFGDVEVRFLGGDAPARLSEHDPFTQLAIRTGREVYGVEPVLSPLAGGSGPMHPFVEYLGVPIANVGVGYPGSGSHGPNEHIRLTDFVLGTQHTARLMEEFGAGVWETP